MGIEQSGTRGTPRLDLGAAFMEWVLNQKDYIGTRVLPVFRSPLKAATFPAITRESMTKPIETRRAAGGNYNRVNFETEDKSFSCEEHGLEGPLDDGQRKLYERDFDAELVTTLQTGNLIVMAQEIRIAAAVFNTTTFTGASLYTDVSSAPWDAVGSDVISQIKAGREKVRQNCGLDAVSLVISKTNLDRLTANTGIKGAIQYVARLTEAEIINALADILGVKDIIVGKSVKNTANKGKVFSGSDIWSDDYAALVIIPQESENLAQPAMGRTILWSEDSPENAVVEEYRDNPTRSDVFRVRHTVDEIIVDPAFGHLLKVDA